MSFSTLFPFALQTVMNVSLSRLVKILLEMLSLLNRYVWQCD